MAARGLSKVVQEATASVWRTPNQFGEHLSKPRAATEGRPYSTFDRALITTSLVTNEQKIRIQRHACDNRDRVFDSRIHWHGGNETLNRPRKRE